MEELFQKALGIESPWFVKSIEFEAANKRLDIHVDFKRGATFSDGSEGAPCKAYDTVKKHGAILISLNMNVTCTPVSHE